MSVLPHPCIKVVIGNSAGCNYVYWGQNFLNYLPCPIHNSSYSLHRQPPFHDITNMSAVHATRLKRPQLTQRVLFLPAIDAAFNKLYFMFYQIYYMMCNWILLCCLERVITILSFNKTFSNFTSIYIFKLHEMNASFQIRLLNLNFLSRALGEKNLTGKVRCSKLRSWFVCNSYLEKWIGISELQKKKLIKISSAQKISNFHYWLWLYIRCLF